MDTLCLTCSDLPSCTSCSGSKFGYGTGCVTPCPVNTYNNGVMCIGKDKASNEINFVACTTLNTDCATCSNSNLCNSCNGGKFAYGKNCLTSCPGNTYNNGTICIGNNYSFHN